MKMEEESKKKAPGILNLLQSKCPRCRIGDMFVKKNPYSKGFMKMHERCEVCGQYFDIEVGFYYGSGYMSYAITVAISAISFFAWWLIIGISYDDNRVIYWLVFNALLILALQPWLMRLSRTIWLATFVKYDPDWNEHPAEVPERLNETHKNGW